MGECKHTPTFVDLVGPEMVCADCGADLPDAVDVPEPEATSIAFGGEAAEGFADWVEQKAGKDYYVRLTFLDGRRTDAILVGSGQSVIDEHGDGWWDAVTWLPADPETGFPVEGAVERTDRVREVYVY